MCTEYIVVLIDQYFVAEVFFQTKLILTRTLFYANLLLAQEELKLT